MIRTNIASRIALYGASKLEKAAAALRGKGFGSYSVTQEVSLALRALGRTPALVLDVGGNRGEYTAAIQARAPECEIVIFEPAHFNVARLTSRFEGSPCIRVEPHGLSDNRQQATLFTNEIGSGAASLSRRNLAHFGVTFDQEETVSLIALDDYWKSALDSRPIDLIKFDVEGHELHAMRGGRAALRATSVIQFEFGGCNIDSRTFFQDFYYLFEELGFDIFRMTPIGLDRLRAYTEEAETFMTTNFLAVRR
jgi:FkbM family methyltransferase